MRALLVAAVLLFAPSAVRAAFGGMDAIGEATADQTSLSLDERAFLNKGQREVAQLRAMTDQALLLAQADAPAPSLPADLQAAPAAAAIDSGWYQLHWTPASSRWQFGLDSSMSVGACLEREIHDGQWLAGPCRDILLLAKDHKVAMHMGVAAMSNAERGNTALQVRLGFNLGPIAKYAASKIPVVDQILDWNPPPFLAHLGDATTLEFMGGPRPIHDASVNGIWTYGVGAKVEVPVDVVVGWIKAGL